MPSRMKLSARRHRPLTAVHLRVHADLPVFNQIQQPDLPAISIAARTDVVGVAVAEMRKTTSRTDTAADKRGVGGTIPAAARRWPG